MRGSTRRSSSGGLCCRKEEKAMAETERKLNPCPFCGCDMKIEAATIDYIETFLIVADPQHKDGCMMGAMATPRSKDAGKLVEFWNRRGSNYEY